MEKLKIYCVKTKDGKIAQCPITGKPLIGSYTTLTKQKLNFLIDKINKETDNALDNATVVLLKEVKEGTLW